MDESGGGAAGLDTPVQVSIDEAPGLAATTDADGRFELAGDFSGVLTVRFAAPAVVATSMVDVPRGADVELDDIRLQPGRVEFSRPRLRPVTGRVALVDCALDTTGAAEVLVDDRTGLANQFLVRISADPALLSGNGDDLPCGQIKLRDRIAVEGVILPDRTVAAIAIIVAPPAAGPDPAGRRGALPRHGRRGQLRQRTCRVHRRRHRPDSLADRAHVGAPE